MNSETPPESIRSIRDVLETKATEKGEETFLRYGDRRISYGELDRKANAIASSFLSRGIEPGDHVCLFLYNSLEYVYTYFALAKIGAVVIPIDTRFSDETLAYVLSNADANTILLGSKTRKEYEAIRNQISTITTEYFVGNQSADYPYREFQELLNGDSSTPPSCSIEETDTFSITYVQRHAAEQPKGVMLPQYSYVNTGWEASENIFGFSTDDRLFTTLPLYSTFTFQLGIMSSLLAGAEFVLGDPFDPDMFWEQVNSHKATVILYLGRILSVLYNQGSETNNNANPVEMAIGHGFGFWTDETLIKNFEERFDVTVLEGYGVTQSASIATYNSPSDRRIGSSGKPVSYADVAIVDESDRPVPPGESGEIVIRPTRPNTMMQGYYNDPERAMEVCRNQWIHSGDIGYMDEDGYLYFVANEDNSIYRGSIAGRISSLEIESVIDAQTGVWESTVVGIENERVGEEIKAVIVPEDGATITPVDICRRCEKRLPYLKVPRYIEVRDEFPRGPSGNIRKEELQEKDIAEAWDRESGYELSR